MPIAALLQTPALYTECTANTFFNAATMMRWFVKGGFQCAVVYHLVTRSSVLASSHSGRDVGSDLETFGMTTFCGLLWIQAATLLLLFKNLTLRSVLAIAGAHLFFFLLLVVCSVVNVSALNSLTGYYSAIYSFLNPLFWLLNLLLAVAAVLPVLAYDTYRSNYFPTLSDHIRYSSKLLGSQMATKAKTNNAKTAMKRFGSPKINPQESSTRQLSPPDPHEVTHYLPEDSGVVTVNLRAKKQQTAVAIEAEGTALYIPSNEPDVAPQAAAQRSNIPNSKPSAGAQAKKVAWNKAPHDGQPAQAPPRKKK